MNRFQLEYVILLALLNLFHRLMRLYLLVMFMSSDGDWLDYVLSVVHLNRRRSLIGGLNDTCITLPNVVYILRVNTLAVFHGDVVFIRLASRQ
jgi:hypothetical protein